MLDDLLKGESQDDPHHWAATFMAHRDLGLGVWAVVAMIWNVWAAAILVSIGYLVIWEGAQIYIARNEDRNLAALIWDGILDSVAVALGCFAAACLVKGLWVSGALAWWSGMVILGAGWIKRDKE